MNAFTKMRVGRLLRGGLLGIGAGVVAAAAAELPGAAAIAELRREIARHDEAYFGRAAPEVSDTEYDNLQRRLTALEQQYPAAAKSVPALARLGDDRSGNLPTGRHREPMLSLEKAYTEDELRAFHARLARLLECDDLEYTVEPKFDGLAVSVTFVGGRLMRALTRGNGTEGDDVTANVVAIPGVPRALSGNAVPQLVEVRGEVFVPWAEFARVNAERDAAGEPAFANPRNLAAGTLRQRDPRLMTERGLRLTFFGVGACDPRSALPPTQHELLARFAEWGLPVVGPSWPAIGADGLIGAVRACQAARARFAFPTDGAVAKLDALAGQRELGTSEAAPRWALAYKFAPERAATRVLAITVQVGRTGVLTPVAELAPVRLGGTTVARATLHNRSEIARNDIRIGDWVYVEKAGEIIPAIVGVDQARRPATAAAFVFPAACPECGAAVHAPAGEPVVRCVNRDCAAQRLRRLEHFVSREAVAIDGFGPAIVDALVSRGRLRDVPDIYRLTRADLAAVIPGEQRVDRLLAAIERSKRAELWRVIYGLGLPQVGATGAKQLARKHGSLEALAAAQPQYREPVAALVAAGVGGAATPNPARHLTGRTFVLTGGLPGLTRAEATQRIEAAGGRVVSTVTRATDYVVVGKDPGAKREQARKLGVKEIDESELLRMAELGVAADAQRQAAAK